MKSALHTPKLDLRHVHLCGFPEVIREFLIRKTQLRALVCYAFDCEVSELSHSSAMQFAPLATRMCHLHIAPQVSSKAHVLVAWLFGCAFLCGIARPGLSLLCELHGRECLVCSACGIAQPGFFSSRVAPPDCLACSVFRKCAARNVLGR